MGLLSCCRRKLRTVTEVVVEVGDTRALNVLTKLHQAPSPALRLLVAGLLVVLTFAGGYAVADYKTVTLSVDGTAMTVTTMKSRVIDIIRENGFNVSDRDDLYPAAGERVSRRREHRAAAQPTAADLAGRPEFQAGLDDGVNSRRGAGPARDDRHGSGRGLARQPCPVGRHGPAGRQRQDGRAQRRRCGAQRAPGRGQGRGAAGRASALRCCKATRSLPARRHR